MVCVHVLVDVLFFAVFDRRSFSRILVRVQGGQELSMDIGDDDDDAVGIHHQADYGGSGITSLYIGPCLCRVF